MATVLIFEYQERHTPAPPELDRTYEAVYAHVQRQLELPKGSYDLYDDYGKILTSEDLQRALKTPGPSGNCCIKIEEHTHFVQIRDLVEQNRALKERLSKVETLISEGVKDTDRKVDAAKAEMTAITTEIQQRIDQQVMPLLDEVKRDTGAVRKQMSKVQEKVANIDAGMLKQVVEEATSVKEEVRGGLRKIETIEESYMQDKGSRDEITGRLQKELNELQLYMLGKMDVVIEADADLRREQQLLAARVKIVADDLRILGGQHQNLNLQFKGSLEERLQGMSAQIGEIRADSELLSQDCGLVRTRVHCIEGMASERWDGFAPGVVYFSAWHGTAKGSDVQITNDCKVATGRGMMAASGVVIGSNEGLVVGDGPCRRYGTAGALSSYYELEVEEITAAAESAGGLYLGLSVQSADEIAAHSGNEFDGWLIGGARKVLICRASRSDKEDDEPGKVPATFMPNPASATAGLEGSSAEAMQLLRESFPPRAKGEVRDVASSWSSQGLSMGDRVGVLFRCFQGGGALLKVAVNGTVAAAHTFNTEDAPAADAIGFLTPVVRLAGATKSAKLLPHAQPAAKLLAT